jgi:hypothetical protein
MELITKDNDKMDAEFMRYSIDTMNKMKLVAGDPAKGERIGYLDRARLEEQAATLLSTGLLKEPMPVDKFVSFDFTPPKL